MIVMVTMMTTTTMMVMAIFQYWTPQMAYNGDDLDGDDDGDDGDGDGDLSILDTTGGV